MLNPRGTWTLFKRESKRYLKVYLQTILAPIVSNLLYLAVFGISLNRALPEVEGITYLAFLVPGLIAMGIINNSFQNPSSSIIIGKYQGIISDLLTIPLKRIEMMAAFIGAAAIRGLIVGSVTLLTMLPFADLSFHSPLIIVSAAVLTSLFFSGIGIIVGIWADEFDKIAFAQSFVLTPLIFLGGVFYPLQNLPDHFQTLSKFNPIVYIIDVLRYGFTGVHAFPISLDLAIVGGMTFASLLVAYLLLRSGWKLQT